MKVLFDKVPGATEYEIWATYCNPENRVKKIVTVKDNKDIVIKKLNGKKLNKTKCVKLVVIAKRNGKRIAKSIMLHVAGPKNRYTNAERIKLKKKAYRLKKGKTAKIGAEVVLADSGKKQVPSVHAPKFRYATSNKNVAVVSKKGKIRAKGKGNCIIYVYTVNGCAQKITVKVTK